MSGNKRERGEKFIVSEREKWDGYFCVQAFLRGPPMKIGSFFIRSI